MVIAVDLVSHGPHVWYAAVMWCQDGHFIDFLRILECRRPWQVNLMCDRNTYVFNRV